jgi:hypothetical protein
VLPQPPLPSYFTSRLSEQLPNAIFTSNPCRIRYRAQELVVLRWAGLSRPAAAPAQPVPAAARLAPRLPAARRPASPAMTPLQGGTGCRLRTGPQPAH